MKYGLEKELFILKNSIIQMVPLGSGLPYDENGILIEARGEPSENICLAVHNLMAEEYRIKQLTNKAGFETSDFPIGTVTRDFKREVGRCYSKGILCFQNMYGYKDHRHNQNEITAGIHISFTSPKTRIVHKDNVHEEITMNTFFDFIKYVKALDNAFKDEIKKSKRNPGFYELKDDGRVEYRSLPSNTNPYKIIDVLESIK